MQVRTLRQELGMSQEEFASRLGLKSKGHLSQIERGEAGASIRVALELERLSGGRIKATELNEEVALVSNHLAQVAGAG